MDNPTCNDSMGAVMAGYYLSIQHDPDVKVLAIIGNDIGMPKKSYMNSLKNFKMIKNVDIVDVYGSEDTTVYWLLLKQEVLLVISSTKVITNN